MTAEDRRAIELRAAFRKRKYPLSEACKRIVALEADVRFLKDKVKGTLALKEPA